MDVTAHSSRQLPSHPLGVATVEVAFSAGPSAETGMLIAQSHQGSVHQREDCPHRDVTPRLVQNPEGAAIPPSCRPAIPLPPFDRHPPQGMNPAVATAKDAAAKGLAGATLHLMPTGRQPWCCYAPVVVALAGGVTQLDAVRHSSGQPARPPSRRDSLRRYRMRMPGLAGAAGGHADEAAPVGSAALAASSDAPRSAPGDPARSHHVVPPSGRGDGGPHHC
jgi:hypothetical protein